MSTYHDIQLAMRSALQTGQAQAWAAANASKSLTVLLGDREKIRPEQYPVVIIMHKPVALREINNAQFLIADDFMIDAGTFDSDPEAAIAGLADLERAIYRDLLSDRTLGALISDLTISTPVGDLGRNHPHHFAGLMIHTERKEDLR